MKMKCASMSWFTRSSVRARMIQLASLATLLSLLAIGSLLLLLQAGRLSFLNRVGGHVQSKICGVHRPYDAKFPKYYRYISELQPPEFTIESMSKMAWDRQLTTPNGGFLRVEAEDGHVMGWGVSMMHHLHCLIMVRDMLTGRPMDQEFETGGELHWAHCLDYMANAILCHADDTLEPPGQSKHFMAIEKGGLDGDVHTHQCRNSTRLFEKMLEAEKIPIKISDLGAGTVFK